MTGATGKVVFRGINDVAYQEARESIDVGPHDVLIQTHYSCISAGTELAKLHGLQEIRFPTTIGNRAIGRVLETGSEVLHVRPGDLVFSHTHHVSHTLGTGLVCPLPDELDRPAAATLGMALVAMAGVQTAGPELGDTAVVFGAGLVGQYAAQLLQNSGVQVVLTDIVQGRLALARECGVRHTLDAAEERLIEHIHDLTRGKGAEIILECTGIPSVIERATACAERSGTIILVGSPRGEYRSDMVPFLQKFHLWCPGGNLNLKGAHEWKLPLYQTDHAKHSMERNCRILADLVSAGRLQIDRLVSRVYAPRAAASAYRDLRDDRENILGAVFDWTDELNR